MIRLDKFLSQMNIGTRSEVKTFIRKGKITVNGVVCKNSDSKINEETDKICYENREITYEKYVYYMLNKPAGVVTATTDNKDKTVMDLLDVPKKDLFPVGRLDKDTEGLLLITNDGQLAHELLSPKKHVEKLYLAHITGDLPKDAKDKFAAGLKVDDEFTAMPAKLEILEPSDAISEKVTATLVTIQEGKFHQVKRMFKAVGCEVIYLKRLQMGNLCLDENLKPGEYKVLSKEMLECLKNMD